LLGVRSRLGPNTAIVDYIALDTALLALVTTSDTAVIRPLSLSRARLRALSQQLRAQLDARVGSAIDLHRTRFDAAVAHELYRALIAPLERDWPGRTRLLIAADAELHALPFDALALDRTGREYVLDRYQITMLPGLAHALTRARPRSAVQRVVAVGAADVPGAASEILAIARSFPDRTIRLAGAAATSANVQALLQPGTVLHFAVHAFPNNVDPERASLKLQPEMNEAGELYAFEIAHWPLRDSFVVLSACETGVGRLFEGEGVLSLARAFFAAGASDVVATLWPVSASASTLMEDFYAGLAQGNAAADAMHRAKLQLRRDPSTRNPFHWASFQLIAGSL
jgi:CHAT domain-containing protein